MSGMTSMIKWTASAISLAIALALAGCGKSTDQAAMSASTAAKKATVPRPAANADENTWGIYLSDQGKVHADDIGMKPYIYVIPSGDGAMAEDRRANETDSIVNGAGSILIPGSLLILGGPDPTTTNAFTTTLGNEVKVDTLRGVTVLVVGDGTQRDALSKALSSSGARVRVAAM
jgi:hypothetical protein